MQEQQTQQSPSSDAEASLGMIKEYVRLLTLLTDDEYQDYYYNTNDMPTSDRVKWLQSYLGETQ